MNIFTRYTLLNLKKNKTRTIVTIIGIILSVAMFTAVTESIVSGISYLINITANTVGTFEFEYRNIDEQQLSAVGADKTVRDSAYTQNIGYAEIDSKNIYKPYVRILGISDNFTDMVAVTLKEGRMPQEPGEIVLSSHCKSNGGVDFKVGDILTLEVGDRVEKDGTSIEGDLYFIDDEKLTDTQKKIYTVVGICSRPDSNVEYTDCPGYTAYTVPEENGNYNYNVYFTSTEPDKVLENTSYGEEYGGSDNINYDLLMFKGYEVGNPFTRIVYSLGAILIIIIMAGSIALIYNSFSISVTERTKQFGILRSIGATDKQMIRTVLTEGLILCGIAVPFGLLAGCGGMAVTFHFVAPLFNATVNSGEIGDVVIKLVPNAAALICAALISIVTTLISAVIPARRAMKKTAIEAVRMSGDIRDDEKISKRSGKLMNSFFGLPGMLASRNYSRNRRKYRTTILSLAMSLILFISASGLSYYFTQSFNMGTDIEGYDIEVTTGTTNLTPDETRETLTSLSKTDGVTEWLYYCDVGSENIGFYVFDSQINQQFDYFPDSNMQSVGVAFINDEAFRKMCADNDLAADEYFNSPFPRAVLFDSRSNVSYNEKNGKRIISEGSLFDINKFPVEIPVYVFDSTDMDNCFFTCNVKNEKTACFANEAGEEITFPLDEVAKQQTLTAAAKIDVMPLNFVSNCTVFLYPESRMNDVYGKTEFDNMFFCGYYKAPAHSVVFDSMLGDTEKLNGIYVEDFSDGNEAIKAIVTLISVFSYGFIVLISLIAAANVFNTVSTNIMLRRRELATLKSVGMSKKDFNKMTVCESLLYGFRSLIIGLPVSFIITYIIYYVISDSGMDLPFTLPWTNIIIAVVSVFAVVFASMIYSMNKLKKYNTADELKNENT